MSLRHGLIVCLFALSSLVPLRSQMGAPASGTGPKPLGLRPPTSAEQAWMDANLIEVKQVLPNRLAMDRVAAEHTRKGNQQAMKALASIPVAEDGAEFHGTTRSKNRTAVPSLRQDNLMVQSPALMAMAYPSAVDNSAEAWFPPVGCQLGGSCASFSTTYYTMTSQVARLRGWNVRDGNDNSHLFSTRFTYNQINNGGDHGSWITTAYDIMLTMGCATYQTLPYIDGDFTSWPTTASIWRDALNYRMATSGSIGGLDTDAGLANAKQMLANGYILNYSTNISTWNFGTLSNDPGTTADDAYFATGVPATRLAIATYRTGTDNHGMTIVGYDDNVWVDLNGNGVVDPGEKGAFRIVNSWCNWWEDGGYVWVAYDALKAASAVSGVTNATDRQPIFGGNTVYWMSARPSYTPSLIAELTLNTAKRNQIFLSVGRGAAGAVVPSSRWSPAGLSGDGGALAFDGGATAIPGTFVIDCSDLLSTNAGPRWFVSLQDNTAGDSATFQSLRFIDGGNVATEAQGTNPVGGLSQTVDNATLHAYADNVMFTNVAPVAQGRSLSLLKDTSRPITLTAVDLNQDTLVYSLTKSPGHGTLSGTAPNLVYTPAVGFQGTDDLSFKANDGKVDSNTAAVVLHVGVATPGLLAEFFQVGSSDSLIPDLTGLAPDFSRIDTQINYAADANFPTGFVDNFASRHTGYLKITTAGSYTLFLNSDDGSKLWLDDTLLIDNDGSHGMVEKSATVTLAAGSHALRVEFYQGGGGKGLILSWTGPSITKAVIPASAFVYPVIPSNTAPVAQAQSLSIAKGTTTPITLVATDADEDVLTYNVQSSPSHGTLFGEAPNLSYVSDANYVGPDSFTFVANDGTADSNTATVSITVAAVNHAPVAQNQSYTILQNTAGNLKLTASDADGDTLIYAVLTQPAHGTLSGTAPNLVYTPTTSYTGPDSFTFRTNDGHVNSNTATIYLHVGTGTQAQGLLAEFFRYAGLSAIPSLTGLVPDFTRVDALINYASDSDYPSGFSADFVIRHTGFLVIGTAGSYTLYLNSDDGSKLYLDGTLLINNDGSHGMVEKSATKTLTVGNHALRVEYYQGGGGKGLIMSWSGPSITKAVVPASAFVYLAVSNTSPLAQNQNLTTSLNTAKSITLAATDADGDPLTYTVVSQPVHGTLSGTAPNLIYQPAANYQGSDPFTFKANDGRADSNIATVAITVSAANHAPVAKAQSVTTVMNTAKAITLSGTDADGDALIYTIVTQPAHGTLSGTAPDVTYTPTTSYTGSDSFTFKVTDSKGAASANATVSIAVSAANHAPVASAQSVTTVANTAKAITLSGTDADGDTLTYAIVTQPAHGTLSGTAPNVTYTPTTSYIGSDSFTFKVTDSKGATSANATVSIAVSAANHAPVATAQSVTTVANTAKAITLSGTDADGDTLTYTIVTQPAHGTLSGTAPNVTYTPTTSYTGGDSFTFKVTDSKGAASANATVSITVSAVKSLDLNGDNTLDVLDLALLASKYGTNNATCDLNGDGTVNDADITLWLAGF